MSGTPYVRRAVVRRKEDGIEGRHVVVHGADRRTGEGQWDAKRKDVMYRKKRNETVYAGEDC